MLVVVGKHSLVTMVAHHGVHPQTLKDNQTLGGNTWDGSRGKQAAAAVTTAGAENSTAVGQLVNPRRQMGNCRGAALREQKPGVLPGVLDLDTFGVPG